MKCTIHLTDEEPVDLYLKGPKWAGVVFELDNYLRSTIKYGHSSLENKSYEEVLQEARHKLYELLDEFNLSFEDIK